MLSRAIFICIVSGLLTCGGAWLYADSATWPSTSPGCGAAYQSPVAISRTSVLKDQPFQKLAFDYTSFTAGQLRLVNDGHFFGVNGHFGKLRLPDGPYNALQLRIHFPSEHTIDGRSAAGELQILHQREGAAGNDGLAVVSILLAAVNGGNESVMGELAFFKNFGFTGSGLLPGTQAQIQNAGTVDLGAFSKRLGGEYFHYEGSLTNPPCFQGIKWYVLSDVAAFPGVSLDEVKAALIELMGRPLQPLNGRKVVQSAYALPGEFLTVSTTLFDCDATAAGEWPAPQTFWCCRQEHYKKCPAQPPAKDPDTWASAFPACAGQQQSPVDIPQVPNEGKAEPLKYYYAPLVETLMVNDGRSLQVVGQFGFLILPDGMYDVTHLRIRYHSEHTRHGIRADGELQIVHYRRGCETECWAVISLPFELAAPHKSTGFFKNAGLGSDSQPPTENKTTVLDKSLDLNAFNSQLSGNYYHYVGSLTEPPCTENVHWYVLEEPAPISREIMNTFKRLFDTVPVRSAQPWHDRQISFSKLSLHGEFGGSDDEPQKEVDLDSVSTSVAPEFDCSEYQPDPAVSQWCFHHKQVQQFRLPAWTWSYEHPERWPQVSPRCGGTAQSPIDIPVDTLTDPLRPQQLKYDYYAYEAMGERKVINDGRVLRVDGDFGVLVLPDGLYQVKHFLFHFPSEHTINGNQALGELQILHQKQGSHGVQDVAIVSLLLASEDSAGRPCEGKEREFFTSLGFGKDGRLPKKGQEVGSFGRVDLKVFHRQLKGDYYHYQGSLTVPPCVEGVHWYVLQQPAAVGPDMIAGFNRLFPNTKHSRPTQPLHGRHVIKSRIGFPKEFGIHSATYVRDTSGEEIPLITTTTTTGPLIECPFDCHSKEPPDEEKAEWCCGHEGLLCQGTGLGGHSDHDSVLGTTTLRPTFPTLPPDSGDEPDKDPFDCRLGYRTWVTGWSYAKKRWCCMHKRLGCEGGRWPSTTTTPYDCDSGYTLWRQGWSDAKKRWCCDAVRRGCDQDHVYTTTTTTATFDCDAGYDLWEQGWSIAKKRWCCETEQRGCTDSLFDCNAGYNLWREGWSDFKKRWCCKTVHRGCEHTTSTTTLFDCDAGYDLWQQGWSQEKKAWCCASAAHRGCETTSTTTTLFDCDAGYDLWQQGWSDAKKAWCCASAAHRGCERTITTTTPLFDCAGGYQLWRQGWSEMKKGWCCAHEQKGCEANRLPATITTTTATSTTTTTTPFDCEAGYRLWEQGWSVEKKKWCCASTHRACDRYDCNFDLQRWRVAWTTEKKEWCCHWKKLGCHDNNDYDKEPDGGQDNDHDCSGDYGNWAGTTWTREKMDWCCKHHHRACYDCRTGYPHSARAWRPEHKEWCCSHEQRGCSGSQEPSQHDCTGDYGNWHGLIWSHEKMDYCCRHEQRACYDCRTGYPHAAQAWKPSHKNWCCKHEDKGCNGAGDREPPSVGTYDCTGDYGDWNGLKWSHPQMEWCCQHKEVGCYDCRTGYPHAAHAWKPIHKAWCCEHEQRGCGGGHQPVQPPGDSYDCSGDYGDWHGLKWSTVQMDWCCQNKEIGCFDCRTGYPHAARAWKPTHKAWCCKHEQRGCGGGHLPVQPPGDSYDCTGDYGDWHGLKWSTAQMEWCCQNKEVGCFDCRTGYPHAAHAWKPTHKAWCCKHEQRGCGGGHQPVQPPGDSYDCSGDYGDWHGLKWSTAQMEWCCQNKEIGCFDCRTGYPHAVNAWKPSHKAWCCSHEHRGCGGTIKHEPLPLPSQSYHCSGDYGNWHGLIWSHEQMAWCCQQRSIACHDCRTGYPHAVRAWTTSKKAWCCAHEHRGCAGGPPPARVSPATPLPMTTTPTLPWENPEDWPRKYPRCAGNIQSPISISPNNCERGPKVMPLSFNYHPTPAAQLVRTAYGFQVNGSFGTLTLPDGVYQATHVRFHFPSEHAIDNTHAAGEVQIHHEKGGGHHAIIALLLVTPEDAHNVPRLPEVQAFFDSLGMDGNLPASPTAGVTLRQELDLNTFRRQLLGKYYHYAGSLTTPPCDEMTHWYVIGEQLLVQPETIKSFMGAFQNRENFRPLQPLNGRQVIITSLSVPGEFFDRTGGWTYTNPQAWEASYPKCGGTSQSPIFINADSVPPPARVVEQLVFYYHPVSSAMIVNNGHDIEVRGPFGTLQLPDGVYEAAEFRFHFPAEHRISGRESVGELQIIHERHGSMSPGLAVIGLLLIVGDVEEQHKRFFDNIGFGPEQHLPGRTAELESREAVDLNAFTNQLAGPYFHYEGSLTLPPCLEDVHWYILKEEVAISRQMLEAFQALFPDPGNNRPIQPLNHRQIIDSSQSLPGEFPGAPAATAPVAGPGQKDVGHEPAIQFDCDAALGNWQRAWSESKKQYCCKHERKGCTEFHCTDNTNRHGWDQSKRTWCCRYHNIGCELVEPVGWSYTMSDDWHSRFPACGGSMQSPISINTREERSLSVQHLTVSYYPISGLRLENTGHVIRVSGQLGQINLPDGLYEAKEISFHFPSEHKKDGLYSAGEMQIVHQKHESTAYDDIAILSVLIDKAAPGIATPHHEFFSNLGFGRPGGLPVKGASSPISGKVDLSDFKEQFKGRYFHYQGSLTTPPCTESVHWYVLEDPVLIDDNMVTAFKQLFPDPANSRPVQKLGERRVVDSRIRLKGTCEYRENEGCNQGGGITGWLMGLLGQKYTDRGSLFSSVPSATTSLWAGGVACAVLLALAVRASRRVRRQDRYEMMSCEEDKRMPVIITEA